MAESIKSIVIAEESIISKIYLISGKEVMLDRDLAEGGTGIDTKPGEEYFAHVLQISWE